MNSTQAQFSRAASDLVASAHSAHVVGRINRDIGAVAVGYAGRGSAIGHGTRLRAPLPTRLRLASSEVVPMMNLLIFCPVGQVAPQEKITAIHNGKAQTVLFRQCRH